MNLSALIIARNEQKKIELTLKSLSFVDEIVVILDRSIDDTKKIASKYTKKIYEGSWKSEGKRRNYGISKCSSQWILEIDADELVTKSLEKEIIQKLKFKNFDFYYVSLTNFIGNKKITKGWMACLAPDGKFCLFRKGTKVWIDGSVHPQYQIKGKKGKPFANSLNHYLSKDISELLSKFNRNTTLYADDLRKEGKSLQKLISVRKIFSRFIKSFITRRGFQFGGLGVLIGILCAIYPYVSAIKCREDRIKF